MDVPTTIYTIGYGARSLDAFLAALRTHGIDYVIDVRTSPYSKFKPEFSRRELAVALQAAGVRYVFMGDALGGKPEDPDCYVDGKVVYERLQGKDHFRQGIERLRKAYDQQVKVVLMCSEGKPEMCHRSKLLGVALAATGITIAHIDEDDTLVTQDAVMTRLTGGQLTLFGEHNLTSRKRYSPDSEPHD